MSDIYIIPPDPPINIPILQSITRLRPGLTIELPSPTPIDPLVIGTRLRAGVLQIQTPEQPQPVAPVTFIMAGYASGNQVFWTATTSPDWTGSQYTGGGTPSMIRLVK